MEGGTAMPKFINRVEELNTLEQEFARDGSSLVILYGRRRVGKTALCTKFMENKNALYFLATEESEALNRNQFKALTAEYLNNQLLALASVDNWDILFQTIVETKTAQKRVLILDEFQYLGKLKHAFPSIFQRIWDTILKPENIMVILCGSLIHMMEAQTLNYGSPLYGRRTAQIKLRQIAFSHYGDFYPTAGPKDLIPLYSVTGGVPKYIELFHQTGDIFQEIDKNILNHSSFLYDEPNFLLQNEVTEVGSYFSIIRTIAAGNQKLGKIAASLEVPQSQLTRYLKTLTDLDILVREVPVTEKSPDKSKKGLYKIKDNFLLFWFRFVYPNKSYLETGHKELVMQRLMQSFADNHVSFIYEDICRAQIWTLAAQKKLPFLPEKVGRWWDNKDAEIDIVAVSESSGHILFGECKYWNSPAGINALEKLKEKSSLVDWNRQTRRASFILFSLNGFTPELQTLAARDQSLILVSGTDTVLNNP